jgi:methylated-DNA-protein-cysteine methyltransferase-like protein
VAVRRAGEEAGFFERVYAVVTAIPKGRVATYGQVAALAGTPQGARAVGWALRALARGRERVVPGHRVVGAGGLISPRVGGGALRQRRLLEAEGIGFRGRRLDLARFGLLS